MKLVDLLNLGYFCEELPPPFNSKLLGSNYSKIKSAIDKLPKADVPKDTVCTNFISPKVGIHRRHFSIPHPYPQIKLSETIVANWGDILNEYKKSSFSISVPEIDKTGKKAITYLDKFEIFREAAIKSSSSKRFELHLDISKYFYSIYTHSIPWAIHSKPIAKADRSFALWGNKIDTYIRSAQSNQTKGIPVGTDTSRIIAEIIGCALDVQFSSAMKKHNVAVEGCRFVDDCRYYFDSISETELALKEYQKLLTEFTLNLNDEKTNINSIPCIFDYSWKSILNSLPLNETLSRKQKVDIKSYFNTLIVLSQKHPRDSVIKYGIKRLLKIKVHYSNMDIFEALLFNTALHEPVILPESLQFLLKNKSLITKAGLSNFVTAIINRNVHKGHNYEISWALWIAKSFSIKIPRLLAQEIINSRDVISIIILLDLMDSRQVTNGKISLTDLVNELDSSSLSNELWLLAYEAEYHGWLPIGNISGNPFFKELQKRNIYFYDRTITPFLDLSGAKLHSPTQPPVTTKSLEHDTRKLKLSIPPVANEKY